MARKQNGETETRWREILERQASSGLSVEWHLDLLQVHSSD
jgi:hypothetical protein